LKTDEDSWVINDPNLKFVMEDIVWQD